MEALKKNFDIGDVVQLMSGGPVMTVSKVGERYVWCSWFDRKDQPQMASFNPKTLKSVLTPIVLTPPFVDLTSPFGAYPPQRMPWTPTPSPYGGTTCSAQTSKDGYTQCQADGYGDTK